MNKIRSLKVNYILNTIKVIMGVIFPLITFPYTSRVLQPAGTGKVSFSTSVVSYFILISSIGIPLYATREAAKVRDDKEELSKFAHEIFIINMISTVISYTILFLAINFNKKLYSLKEVIYVLSLSIIFNTLAMDWLYQALENYLYITVRTIFFQIVSLGLLFVFVKNEGDYLSYAALSVLSSGGSSILNFIYARKYIFVKKYKDYKFKKHLKPIFTLFAINVSTSVYVNLNSVMLGFICGDESVGIYSAAYKVIKLILSVVTSLGIVLMPRSSYYISNDKIDEFNGLIKKAFNFIIVISIPIIVGLFMLSKELITIFCGTSYLPAVTPMRIMLATILIISISNLIGVQILIPLGKESITLYSSIIGAIVNVVMNLILLSKYAENGAAISNLLAETSVTIFLIIAMWDRVKNSILDKRNLVYLLGGLLIILQVYLLKLVISNIFIIIATSVVICSITYFLLLVITKDSLVLEILNRLRKLVFKC